MRLVLASASPRRAELLQTAGFEFDVLAADVDETMDVEETPDGYARRLAQLKAEAVAARRPGAVVLGADTIVVVDHAVLGKPKDLADARRMLRLLSGREHVVLTAVCLLTQGPADAGPHAQQGPREGESKRVQTAVARTTVEFSPLSTQEIEWYVGTGEPMDKAGAYAVQGLASRFVTRVDGSYSNVVGLPVALVYALCKRTGLLIS